MFSIQVSLHFPAYGWRSCRWIGRWASDPMHFEFWFKGVLMFCCHLFAAQETHAIVEIWSPSCMREEEAWKYTWEPLWVFLYRLTLAIGAVLWLFSYGQIWSIRWKSTPRQKKQDFPRAVLTGRAFSLHIGEGQVSLPRKQSLQACKALARCGRKPWEMELSDWGKPYHNTFVFMSQNKCLTWKWAHCTTYTISSTLLKFRLFPALIAT